MRQPVALFSPGWYVCVLTRVQMSAGEWEVPGLVAMVNYGRKKQCEVRDDVFHGPPNFGSRVRRRRRR